MNERIKELISDYFNGALDPDSWDEFKGLLLLDENQQKFKNHLDIELHQAQYEKADPEILERIMMHITDQRPTAASKIYHRVHFIRTAWFRYAAIILLLAGIGTLYFINKHSDNNQLSLTTKNSQIKPGSNKAILTLSNGKQVVLNDSANQVIQDGQQLIDQKQGQLNYTHALTSESLNVSFNTMTTPRGGQYQVVLNDGTKVWLNSASSLRFPTAFTERTRVVELTGEGYFEISENKSKPFIVQTKLAQVTVLGTQFNVSAFEDEEITATTLVQGSVKVSGSGKSMTIKPNEQIRLSNDGSRFQIIIPKMEEVLAWRQGKFKFQGAKIQDIMRQISRWYNVEIIYRGKIPESTFNGSLLRTDEVYELLDALSSTDKIHFQIDKNKIIVINGPKP